MISQLKYDPDVLTLDLGDEPMVPAKKDVNAEASWYGIPIEGFNGPGEEMIRACMSRIPRELLTNVECIKAAPELHPKHGRYDPTNKTVNINPLIFNLRQRFGNGQGWIYQSELCTVHEVGHSIYYFFPEKTKDEWRDISGWMVGSQDGQAPPYKETRPGWEQGTSKWTHKKGVKFTRKYATKNDDEDFADSFAFYLLNKPHQMEPAKRDFIQNVIADRVKKYPQVLVEGPTKPYGERDLAAYGTSEGVTKAWDERGRGRKQKIGPVYRGLPVGANLSRKVKNDRYTVGSFFSASPEVARAYGPQVFQAFVHMKHPYVVDAQDNMYSGIPVPKEMRKWVLGSIKEIDSDLIAEYAYKHGYDGVILKNVAEPNHPITSDDYIVFNSNQITQIGDPITPPKFRPGYYNEPLKFTPIKAYGTSEGVTKAWDTRGRGRHENFKDFVSGVRFAKKEDFKELDRWFQESNPDVEADDRATNAADIAAEIALDKSSDTFIAEQNGQIIGALEVDPNFSPKQIEVKYLAVNPDIFRGNIQAKGTGTHLMVQAAKYAAYHNKGVFLSALPSARGFYKKLGMRNPNGGAYNWDADEAKAVASYGTGVSN